MDRKIKAAIVAVTILGLTGSAAFAQEGGEAKDPAQNPEMFRKKIQGKVLGFMKEELDLTPEQVEQLKAKREAQRDANKEVREKLKVQLKAMHAEIAKPETDRAKIQSEIAEINALRGQLFAQSIEGVLDMKEVLTPEQFAKMQEFRKERKEKVKKRLGKRMDWLQEHGEGGEGPLDE